MRTSTPRLHLTLSSLSSFSCLVAAAVLTAAPGCTVSSSDGRAPFVSAGELGDVEDTDDAGESGADTGTGGTTGGGDDSVTDPGDGSHSGSSTSDSGEPVEPDPPGMCEYGFVADAVAPEIVLVLDRSSSMVNEDHESYSSDGGVIETPRWELLHGFVSGLVGDSEGDARFGVVLFPSAQGDPDVEGSECLVADEPTLALGEGEGQHDAVLSSIPSADTLDFYGASPLRAGVERAADQLLASETGAPAAIVLVTDGAGNCADPAKPFSVHDGSAPALLEELHDEHGIATFVVGVDVDYGGLEEPEVNPYSALSKLAVAGGQTKSVDEAFFLDGELALLGARIDGMARAAQCAFTPELPEGADIGALSMTIANQPIDRVDDCEEGSGWRAVETESGEPALELCGVTCDLFAAGHELVVTTVCE